MTLRRGGLEVLRIDTRHSPSVLAFRRLVSPEANEDGSVSLEVLALVEYMRGLLRTNLAIVWRASASDGQHWGTCIPKTGGFSLTHAVGRTPIRLKPHVYLRPSDGGLMVDCPYSEAQVLLPSARYESMSAILDLARPRSEWDARCLELLCAAGMIEFAEEEARARMFWEFHDAIFHTATRMRPVVPQGGTYRFAGKHPPEPAKYAGKVLRRLPGTTQYPEEIAGGDTLKLKSLLARRKSTRSFDAAPVSFATLSQLMHSCFRTVVIGRSNEQEICSRPYPSGGALYETECYLAVNNCIGLPRGVYRYDGAAHEFQMIAEPNDASERLLDRARWSCPPMDFAPPVLLVLTARMGRIAWKYESIAYRTALLNAGVILQTLYLLCAEIGLGCCAVGLGDSIGFSEATGIDEITEPSVAELALGLPRIC